MCLITGDAISQRMRPVGVSGPIAGYAVRMQINCGILLVTSTNGVSYQFAGTPVKSATLTLCCLLLEHMVG